jgi:pseudouridine-5'-phosphate glycosidase
MLIAAAAGIRIFSTGGIGGVHRGGENSLDISRICRTGPHPVAVVCAGAKQILDIGGRWNTLKPWESPSSATEPSRFRFYCRDSATGWTMPPGTNGRSPKLSEQKRRWPGRRPARVQPHSRALRWTFPGWKKLSRRAAGSCGGKHNGQSSHPVSALKGHGAYRGRILSEHVQLALNNARCAARIAVFLSEFARKP